MIRKDLMPKITHYLSLLQLEVKNAASLNLLDGAVHSENFFRDLMNLVFGWQLENQNAVCQNAAAIDLHDDVNRLAIQVTISNDFEKIKRTHGVFVKEKMYGKYSRLIVFIIGDKLSYKAKVIGDKTNIVMTIAEDVLDIRDLLRKIGTLSLAQMEACLRFLENQLQSAKSLEPNEVQTLIRLIEVLSEVDEIDGVEEHQEDPDPERKIHCRFADHSEFLLNSFSELFGIYGRALDQVKENSDLNQVKIRKLHLYLKAWSDRILNEVGGDPKQALALLQERVLKKMGGSAGFDDCAVRFYLLNQLIECNVFPNKKMADA